MKNPRFPGDYKLLDGRMVHSSQTWKKLWNVKLTNMAYVLIELISNPSVFFFFKDALELDSKSHPGWNCTLKEQEICPLVQTMIFFLFFCFLHQQNAPKKLQEHRKESKSLKLFTSLATYAWKRERNYTNQCIICLVLSFNLPPILFPHGTCSRQSITTHINWNGVLLIPNDDKFRLPLRLSWQN